MPPAWPTATMACLVLSAAASVEHVLLVLRLVRIVYEVVRFALAGILRRLHLGRSDIRAPEQLCFALARLGTTFIKFGQALSIRRDLLPDDYVTALQSLQDHIAPFPAEHAMREIERGLGGPITQILHPAMRGRRLTNARAAKNYDRLLNLMLLKQQFGLEVVDLKALTPHAISCAKVNVTVGTTVAGTIQDCRHAPQASGSSSFGFGCCEGRGSRRLGVGTWCFLVIAFQIIATLNGVPTAKIAVYSPRLPLRK